MNIECVFSPFSLYLQTIRVGVLDGLFLLVLIFHVYFIVVLNSLMTFNAELSGGSEVICYRVGSALWGTD